MLLTATPVAATEPLRDSQWAIDRIAAEPVWSVADGTGITVAVVDTGIAPIAELDVADGASFVDADPADDPLEHGTAVAAIIAAAHDGRGIAGVAPGVTLLNAQVHDGAAGDDRQLADGIRWAADNGADVINASIAVWRPSADLDAAVEHATSLGAVVIAAAGNDPDRTAWPAAHPDVIAVAATDPDDLPVGTSGNGPHVDVAAPGFAVMALDTAGEYTIRDGTSYAAAYVTGTAALVADATGLRGRDLADRLMATADDVDQPGVDPRTGAGVVRADRAVGRAGTDATGPVDTAVALSRATFRPAAAAHAVIGRADAFPDSLAGTALVGTAGPLLLTAGHDLDPAVRDELVRAVTPRGAVYVLGGSAAISDTVLEQIGQLGFSVERVAGDSRITTATAIASRVDPNPDTVLLARADSWSDAVTGGAWAAATGTPLLLTWTDNLPGPTADWLATRRPDTIVVLGGTAAVSDAVVAQLGAAGHSTQRVAGPDRAGTAEAVLTDLWDPSAAGVTLVDGWADDGWAAALAAAPAGRPQLLVNPDVPSTVEAALEHVGGTVTAATATVTDAVEALLDVDAGLINGLLGGPVS